MILDPARQLLLRARLTQAEEAYNDLLIGAGVREVRDQNGESMSFTPASSSRLAQYIQALKTELGLLQSPGPVRPFW